MAHSRWPLRLTRILVYVLALLTPIVFDQGADSRFRHPQLLLVQIIGALLLWMQCAHTILNSRFDGSSLLRGLRNRLRSDRVLTLLLLILVWCGLSALWSPIPQVSLQKLVTLMAYVGVFWAVYRIGDRSSATHVAWILVAGGWLNALWALLQFTGQDPLFKTTEGLEITGGIRLYVFGFSGNPNFLAPFILFCLIVSCTLLVVSRSKLLKALCILSALLFLLVLVIAQTMAALVSLAAVIAVFLAGALRFRIVSASKVLAVGLTVLVLVTIGVLSTRAVGGDFQGRIERIEYALRQGNWDYLLTGRYYCWLVTWESILDKPFIGHGLGTLPRYYSEYATEYPKLDHYEFVYLANWSFMEAHNDYLQIWAETGLVGISLMAGLIAILVIRVYRKIAAIYRPRASQEEDLQDPTGGERILMIGWGAVVLACAVNAMAMFPMHVSFLTTPLTLALGFSAKLAGLFPRGSARTSSTVAGKVVSWVLVTLAAIATMTTSWGFIERYQASRARHDLRSDFEVLSTLRRQGRSASPESIRGARAAVSAAQENLELDPYTAENHLDMARAYALAHQNQAAAASFAETNQIRTHPDFYMQMGAALMDMGDFDGARRSLGKALRYDPYNARVQGILITIGQDVYGHSYPPPVVFPFPHLAVPRKVDR